jgi:hypothetical protein
MNMNGYVNEYGWADVRVNRQKMSKYCLNGGKIDEIEKYV